jgi:NADPH:quinone reductase-like Zn-dependent oxidoreductase
MAQKYNQTFHTVSTCLLYNDYISLSGVTDMKAAQITSYGGKEVLKVTEAPKPKPGPDEVLVEVHAAATNPYDYKIREGIYQNWVKLSFPATLGGDVSGIVSEVGEGVEAFKPGQEVFGQANASSGEGSYAEFTPVKTTQLALKPDNLDFTEAAALPLTSCSAYQALVDHMNLKPGQKILIHGGAGGIGSMAKDIGAHITTTVGPNEADYVKSLGADEVIDYTTQEFNKATRSFDAVYDTVGGETNAKSYMVLKPGGSLVSMVEDPNPDLVHKHDVKYVHQSTQVTQKRLAAITKLVQEGKLKTVIDKIYSFGLAAEALEYLKTGHPKGKVVIQVK